LQCNPYPLTAPSPDNRSAAPLNSGLSTLFTLRRTIIYRSAKQQRSTRVISADRALSRVLYRLTQIASSNRCHVNFVRSLSSHFRSCRLHLYQSLSSQLPPSLDTDRFLSRCRLNFLSSQFPVVSISSLRLHRFLRRRRLSSGPDLCLECPKMLHR